VLDLRQVQCVRDACRRVVHFCSECDRGHIYCSDACHKQVRGEARCRSKQRYWKSFDGRWATARRVKRFRDRRAQNVTDTGRQEVAPMAIVPGPTIATFTMAVAPIAEKDATNEQSMDGDIDRATRNARARDARGASDDLESTSLAGAEPAARADDPAASGGDVAGREGPRCALCGRLGWGVRLEPLSRSGH
jgi:hypothetical protein